MTKVLVERELLERIVSKINIVWQKTDETEELRAILARPAHDVEASVPDVAGWLWHWLMDYCKRKGQPPAMRDDLFQAVSDMRATLAIAQPAHDVEASVPTFPCESCGAFHSYSEVAEAGGYCPQCEADYDERKMFADLLGRYTALAAAPAQPLGKEGGV